MRHSFNDSSAACMRLHPGHNKAILDAFNVLSFFLFFLSFLTQKDGCVGMESMYVIISVISIHANKCGDSLMQLRTHDAISIASSHCYSHFQIQLDAYRLPGYHLPLHLSSETLHVSARVYMPQTFLSSTSRDIYILVFQFVLILHPLS